MTALIRTACSECSGDGETVDDRGIVIVCPGCLGHGFKYENPPHWPRDLPVREAVAPDPLAEAREDAPEVWHNGEDGAP